MPEQRCETCGWSEDRKDVKTLNCTWFEHNPTPSCISANPSFVYRTDGTCCQCWKPKEGSHE